MITMKPKQSYVVRRTMPHSPKKNYKELETDVINELSKHNATFHHVLQ